MSTSLNSLKPNTGSRKKKLRKGRGIAAGQGASCGFGMRGQKSRSGRPTRPGFEGGQMPLYRRLPMRGFINNFKKDFQIVNLEKLNELGVDEVNAQILYENGLIRSPLKPVKILGNGNLDTVIKVYATEFSKTAKDKIEKIGGQVVKR